MVMFMTFSFFFMPGVDPDYDRALADIQATRVWFDQYLKKQCTVLGCRVSVSMTSSKL